MQKEVQNSGDSGKLMKTRNINVLYTPLTYPTACWAPFNYFYFMHCPILIYTTVIVFGQIDDKIVIFKMAAWSSNSQDVKYLTWCQQRTTTLIMTKLYIGLARANKYDYLNCIYEIRVNFIALFHICEN